MVGLPATAYYDRKGELAYLHQGGYASEDKLARGHRALRSLTFWTSGSHVPTTRWPRRSTCASASSAASRASRAEADRDGRDPEATHLVAVEDGEVLGTCRLVFRGTWPGSAGSRSSRRPAGAAWPRRSSPRPPGWRAPAAAERISLHAQTYAKELYLRDGYELAGEPFVEEGIEHVAMEKRLA